MVRAIASSTAVFAAIAFMIPAASAQMDLSTTGSAMIQTGQVSTMNHAINRAARGGGSRSRHSGVTQRQQEACAGKSRFRSEHGADHPKVQRLYSLCRGVGL